MELCKEILVKLLSQEEISVTFSGLILSPAEMIEGQCYQALQRIKKIIHDDSLDDPECFMRIEEIICILEEIGSSGGSRHDFG